jgi:hypothetical protein
VLYLKRKRIRSRKSPIRRVQQEIEFNDTFHVHVSNDALKDVSLKCFVIILMINYELILIKVIIGIAVYGKSASFVNKHLLGRTHVGESCLSPQVYIVIISNLINFFND